MGCCTENKTGWKFKWTPEIYPLDNWYPPIKGPNEGVMEENKELHHIRTFTGRTFYSLAPRSEDVDIEDIAHALSNQCRFSGHTRKHYSVAEHSVRASYIVHEQFALCALLHDATEAYLVDLPRPIKQGSEIGKLFREIEGRIWIAVAKRFGLPEIMPEEIHQADAIMLVTEKRDLMPCVPGEDYSHSWEGVPSKCLPDKIEPWTPSQTKDIFLDRYYELAGYTLHNAVVDLDRGKKIFQAEVPL